MPCLIYKFFLIIHKGKKIIKKNFPDFEVFRSEAGRGIITDEIIRNLFTADIVIADLTDYNPNVFWELGVRDSRNNNTITIAQNGTKIPFDINQRGLIFYDKYHLDEDFEERLYKEIRDCCVDSIKTTSPVLRAISGKGSLYTLIHKDEINRKLNGFEDEINSNIRYLNGLYKGIEENIEKRKAEPKDKGKHLLMRLQNLCLLVLISERYLDIKNGEYSELYYLDETIRIINSLLDEWLHSPISVEDKFLQVKTSFLEKFDNISKKIPIWKETINKSI
jgi:hypothetical protein